MTKEQAIKILGSIPEDVYTLDDITPIKVKGHEIWSQQLYKEFMYSNNDQVIKILCIVDWNKDTFNLAHAIHNTKQELPAIYSKIGEKMIAYFTLFGLKRDFYL